MIQIVFETHSWSEDNDRGIATGWAQGQLSERGQELAAELGERRRNDGLAAVFTSDLTRAVETATVALGGSGIPILHDWRLRECDYGDLNETPAAELHIDRRRYLDTPYPNGESWRQAVRRAGRFLNDLPLRWADSRILIIGHVATRWADSRILIIGHVATRWALDHYLNGIPLEDLIDADFAWREGWEYRFDPASLLQG